MATCKQRSDPSEVWGAPQRRLAVAVHVVARHHPVPAVASYLPVCPMLIDFATDTLK